MEYRLSATDLARKVGDILGRIRYRGDSFVVERNGEAVARMIPAADRAFPSLHEAIAGWMAAGPPDGGFATDLERVSSADAPPDGAWGS